MTIPQYIETRGVVPTKLNESSVSSTLYALYVLVDDAAISKQPSELRSTVVGSYTYYCIFECDLKTRNIKRIITYLDEEEALALYLNFIKK